MRSALLIGVLLASPALAGGGRLYAPQHFASHGRNGLGPPVYLGPSWQNGYLLNQGYYPYYSPYVVPYTVPLVYPTYSSQPEPPPPPPAPQPVVIEREVIREVPAPAPEPAPAPQVVVVQVPAPAPAPAPAAAPEPPRAAAPRVPGPDVYSWTDDDGVVHYSTRVPAAAKGKAKKLVALEP